MSLDRLASTATQPQPPPILNQISAWVVADTLQTHLVADLTPYKARLLAIMARDLAAWLEEQAA